MENTHLRDLLARLLAWEDAHVSFDVAVAGISVAHRGTVPTGLPHSPWQLVEHLRLAQHDILDFCVNPQYEELQWPEDYWPSSAVPPSDSAWDESIDAVRRDRAALQQLARDATIALAGKIPHGSGQTYARELVLAADHAAYHVGQLVLVRQALGDWK
jgi:DinB family protein